MSVRVALVSVLAAATLTIGWQRAARLNVLHNIGIIRHNVVALARQAEQAITSGAASQIDRAAIQTDMSALGRFLTTRRARDMAAFKTPDLRNVLR